MTFDQKGMCVFAVFITSYIIGLLVYVILTSGCSGHTPVYWPTEDADIDAYIEHEASQGRVYEASVDAEQEAGFTSTCPSGCKPPPGKGYPQ